MSLERLIDESRERFAIPGMAIGVVRDGEIVLKHASGLRDAERGLPVTSRTVFAIGSATKAFTAALCGALVSDGLLDWDRPVREYLPWFRMYDPMATERLTTRDMLCHRSGLPRHDIMWYGRESTDREALVRALRHLQPSKDFRQAFQYNNLLFATAGYLAGQLMGTDWEHAVSDRLLGPLGMTTATVSVHESQRLDDHALPYQTVDGRAVRTDFRVIDLVGPAGSINASLEDMLAFIAANLDDGRRDGMQIMSPATVREMHTAQMLMPSPSMYPESSTDAYGLGWFVGTYRGRRLVHHGGNIDGFTARMVLAPDDGIGIVLLANQGTSRWVELCGYAILDSLLGPDEIPWADRCAEADGAIEAGVARARERAAARYATDTTPSHPLEDYAGEYEHPAYGVIRITVEDGELVPAWLDLETRLSHRHYDVFEMLFPHRDEIRLPIVFRTDADGEIDAITARVEPTVDPAVFVRKPDARLTDPAVLDRLAGSYALGPVRLRVERRGEAELTVVMGSGEPAVLIPRRDWMFTVSTQPGVTAEFEVNGDGPATGVTLHSIGTFDRQS